MLTKVLVEGSLAVAVFTVATWWAGDSPELELALSLRIDRYDNNCSHWDCEIGHWSCDEDAWNYGVKFWKTIASDCTPELLTPNCETLWPLPPYLKKFCP